MNIKKIALLACAVLLISANLRAQEPVAKPVPNQKEKKPQGVSYLRFELAHEEARVGGSTFVANRIGVNIDNYFVKKHRGLSGYTITYKKYLNYEFEQGHFFGAKVFREFTPPRVKAKFNFGAGLEWGNLSGLYDKTRYSKDKDGNILAYTHAFESRNSNIPYLKPHHDAVWHTLVEASIVKRGNSGIVQAGIRANLMSFGVDEYKFSGDTFVFNPGKRIVVVPSVFVSFGLKI